MSAPPDQDGQSAPLPRILVVIPTRNRPTDLARCLESLTTVDYPSWELLIVDQSDDDAARRLIEACWDRLPALTYMRTPERGLCRARNIGLKRASTGIVAYLDDDCTVSAEWLTEVAATFLSHRSATLVFGSFHAVPHDPRQVFVPAVVFEREREVAGVVRHADSGMGGSMYLWPARSAHRHRFDVHLGSGTRWPAADDWDYGSRLILAGETLVLTPRARVSHHGARSLEDGAARKLSLGYALALGAMDMKMIRCGDREAVWRVLDLLRIYIINVLSALATGRRPLGLGRLAMYMRGLAESFLLPVDRVRRLYVTAKPAVRRS